MIYVVELPERGDPLAWFAYDDDDFARKIAAADVLQPWEIYDQTSPRSLLEDRGLVATDAQARTDFPAICALGDTHGWDTPLYRADHLLGRGALSADVVSERDALAAALAARGGQCCIYWDDRTAIAAFEGADPRIAGKAFWHARRALYEQLVALEVLADDN
ncbi:MAG TPA: hypothetical protein VGC24_06935 [Burkholderiaceae bacterium]